jgi:para-aminobenzoate synthetase
MRTLLIDNHDSYTFNLFQLIAEVTGVTPVVLPNDAPELLKLDTTAFDSVVISPGSGGPRRRGDIGYLAEFLGTHTELPVLGVCLGHQVIAHEAGADVGPAPRPRHGHLTTVRHDGDALFDAIPETFTAVRYHSLSVREPLPADLIPLAWAEDGVLMALRHRRLPRWGVQFHPESVASDFGKDLLANFAKIVSRTVPAPAPPSPAFQLLCRAVATKADAATIFATLFASSPECFWLDSSLARPGLSRFSFLGDSSGPLSETLTYRVGDGKVTVTDAAGTRSEPGNPFNVLGRKLGERRLATRDDAGAALPLPLPLPFTGGYVGYFGYEMKADCGADAAHAAPAPDAVWIFADRLVAVDHEAGRTYLLAIHDGTGGLRADASRWLDETSRRLADLVPASEPAAAADRGTALDLAGYLVRDPAGYQRDVAECQRQLVLGESYEICLTTRLHLPFGENDLDFYLRLRAANPAPYAALLRAAGVTVFSSSPERFLRIAGDRRVESKPIKGTAPRHPDPERDARAAAELASSPKTRAENLMIVDLLRNDLGQVCEIGSVDVTSYMAVESYTTVHQLVSTIEGRLRPGVSAVDCARHCFPGGSMTGAPKLRTMRIIDRLETEARGVYSGALGYFGLDGAADLSIVIRTAVRHGGTLTVGAGGAIVLDSDPLDEYEEMLLKAAAPLRAYQPVPEQVPR